MCCSLNMMWNYFEFLFYDFGVEFFMCLYGNVIFVFGGSLKFKGMLCYYINWNMWLCC